MGLNRQEGGSSYQESAMVLDLVEVFGSGFCYNWLNLIVKGLLLAAMERIREAKKSPWLPGK